MAENSTNEKTSSTVVATPTANLSAAAPTTTTSTMSASPMTATSKGETTAATAATAAKAAKAATTAGPPIPCEFDRNTGEGSVGELFDRLCLQEPTSSAFNKILVELFRKHPFVKKRTKLEFYKGCDGAACSHSFEVYGFLVDAYKFSKWIRTGAGRQYKSIAGGVSDDGLYTLSEVRVREGRVCVGRRDGGGAHTLTNLI